MKEGKKRFKIAPTTPQKLTEISVAQKVSEVTTKYFACYSSKKTSKWVGKWSGLNQLQCSNGRTKWYYLIFVFVILYQVLGLWYHVKPNQLPYLGKDSNLSYYVLSSRNYMKHILICKFFFFESSSLCCGVDASFHGFGGTEILAQGLAQFSHTALPPCHFHCAVRKPEHWLDRRRVYWSDSKN